MPRRAKFPPPIYSRNGTDRARVWTGGKPKDYTLGPSGSPEAAAAYARLVADLTAGRSPAPVLRATSGPTVADVAAAWLAEESPRYDPAGREPAQFRFALKPLLRLYGTLPAAGLGPNELETYRLAVVTGSWRNAAERSEQQRRGKPLDACRNTANHRAARIKGVWRWAERKGLVPPGSWSRLCTLPPLGKNDARVRHTQRRKPAFWADVEKVAPHCPGCVAAMLRVQALAGLRSCEVRLMKAGNVIQDGSGWLYVPEKHKNDWRENATARVVPLGPRALEVLRPLLEGLAPDEYVFRTRLGTPYRANSYADRVAKACRKAGVKWTPYALRHGYRLSVTREMGLDAARAAMGHTSVDQSAAYAQQVDLETARKVADRLG